MSSSSQNSESDKPETRGSILNGASFLSSFCDLSDFMMN